MMYWNGQLVQGKENGTEMTKYSIVKKHVDAMDYYSLLLNGAPDDEFDSESWEISDKISCGQTEEDIAGIIADVFNRTFQQENTADCFRDCARKIYADLHC